MNANVKQKFEKSLLILLGALALTTVLFNFEFNFLEASLYDLRMTTTSGGFNPDPNITIIALDEKTTQNLNEYAPLPLNFHTQLIEALEIYQPKSLGYLVNMNYVNQVNPDLFEDNWGRRFVEAAHRLEMRGTPVLMGTPFDINGEVLPPYPLSSLQHAIAVIHKDGNVFAQDKVTRRALTHLYNRQSFHLRLAKRSGYLQDADAPLGSFKVSDVDGQYFFFRYHADSTQQKYNQVSFSDVINGNVPKEKIDGKILLVGTLNKENPSDFALTPFSRKKLSSPRIVVHANIVDSMIHNSGIVLLPKSVHWGITFILTALVIWAVLTFRPVHGVFITFGLAGGVLGLTHLLFLGLSGSGYWIQTSQPLMGILLSYYLAVPYRLIREYKKRWEFQRQSEILKQVEELKTNFLSLVTHDLKTPVARIQGLSEVLLRKAADRLNTKDRETVGNIVNATDDLNHFITSILELTKIESNEVKIQYISKDINEIISKSIQRLDVQARDKDIEITQELEPMFPIQFDPNLISKVLNNLIDNAVKYSPEGSKVHVYSKEIDLNGVEWLEIGVRDSGIGLTQTEIEKLFTKFYRAKNDTTTKVAGTGLGLYLTQYFVEAHHGKVLVESTYGQGSTFKIRLPMDIAKVAEAKKVKKSKKILNNVSISKESKYV